MRTLDPQQICRWIARVGTAAAILLLAAASFAVPLRWTPAAFRGLIVGNSKRADAVKTLGEPDARRRIRGTIDGEELLYNGRGDHKGDVAVRLDRSGVIVEIQESFPVAIPRSRIYKELGRDAVTARYTQDRCGAFYRDPNGPIELTFYPSRGIYLWPDQYGYDFAAIHYAARPPGVDRRPPCNSRK